jgi:magnesium-transporting ATPase (P-type)
MQYELDAMKEIKEKLSKSEDEHSRRIDLLRGIALGLVLGILCHLFVQFLYPVTEALLLGELNTAFTGNLTICVISLILVVCVSAYLYWQLRQSEDKLKLSKKSEEVLEYAIKRRQYNLEQRNKE